LNTPSLELALDPEEASRLAHLRYVSDAKPGITRKRWGRSFRYFDLDGKPIHDEKTLARIKSLVIPPRWREVRDETKFERMKLFGESLPSIRQHVERDLALPVLPREKVLATIVRLLESTFIRVGNEEYARENHSYGLTTLRNKHVDIKGSKVRFEFKGKSGKPHVVDLDYHRLARIVKRCLDLPGYDLFQYLDEGGHPQSIDSADVNDYLREITGQSFTAKDFRTWAGSVLACALLGEAEAFESESQAKKNVVAAIKSVAERLGNTPAVCRKCYVHPAVLESYTGGLMLKAVEKRVQEEIEKTPHNLRKEERDLLRLLEKTNHKIAHAA